VLMSMCQGLLWAKTLERNDRSVRSNA
jgi:hypothetical protein